MKFSIVRVSFLPIAGMAIFPFILIKKGRYKEDKVFINHEKIHLAQQIELLLVIFYLLYLLHYFYNLLRYLNHDRAYRNIVFEKEAYSKESDLEYLAQRSFCQWTRFF